MEGLYTIEALNVVALGRGLHGYMPSKTANRVSYVQRPIYCVGVREILHDRVHERFF